MGENFALETIEKCYTWIFGPVLIGYYGFDAVRVCEPADGFVTLTLWRGGKTSAGLCTFSGEWRRGGRGWSD